MSQVILFDLDGTLTESGEGIINCVQYALEKLGKKEEHPENLQCFIGPPLKEQFMKYAGLSEEEGEKAVVYYRERYITTGIFENRLYPKIPELLELLRTKCCPFPYLHPSGLGVGYFGSGWVSDGRFSKTLVFVVKISPPDQLLICTAT